MSTLQAFLAQGKKLVISVFQQLPIPTKDFQNMDKNQGGCPTEARERLFGTEKLEANIPAKPPIQILRTTSFQQTCSQHRNPPHRRASWSLPGKSTIGQLLNLTQHIEDGFQKKKITEAVFVDLTAVYNTVNQCLLFHKVLNLRAEYFFVFTCFNFFS